MKLLISNYEVKVNDEVRNNDFLITMNGPENSPYEGVFKLKFILIGHMASESSFARRLPI
jgi:hypothetical protein